MEKQQFNLTIKDVTVQMTKLNAPKSCRKKRYAPITMITYNETKEPYYLWLDGALLPENYYEGFIIGRTYFVGITPKEYLIYDLKGERTGSVPVKKVGKALNAEENYVVCYQELRANPGFRAFNVKGEIAPSLFLAQWYWDEGHSK